MPRRIAVCCLQPLFEAWRLSLLLATLSTMVCGQSHTVDDSFEGQRVGPMTTAQTAVGHWVAPPGHATIHDAHQRSGLQCLRILGGPERTVHLTMPETAKGFGLLVFTAERWTRRTPFTFRIAQRVGTEWTTLYQGERLSRLRAPASFLMHFE